MYNKIHNMHKKHKNTEKIHFSLLQSYSFQESSTGMPDQTDVS